MAEVIDPVAPLSVFTNININPNMDKWSHVSFST